MRTRLIPVLVCRLAMVVLPARAQTPAPQSFEVVTLKPNRSGAEDNGIRTSPGRLTVVNATPYELLLYAFGVRESQLVGGPAWLTKEKFDVAAVTGTSADLTHATLQLLLQAMFADRFHLAFHRENRQRWTRRGVE